MRSAKKQSWRFWGQVIFLVRGHGRSVCSNGDSTAITPLVYLFIEKTEMIRVLHAEHAFSDRFVSYMLSAQHPNRRGFDRPAFQFQRETAGSDSSAARSLRQGTPTSKDASQGIAGDAGGNDWHNAIAGEFFHEQIQETGLHSFTMVDFRSTAPSSVLSCTSKAGGRLNSFRIFLHCKTGSAKYSLHVSS